MLEHDITLEEDAEDEGARALDTIFASREPSAERHAALHF